MAQNRKWLTGAYDYYRPATPHLFLEVKAPRPQLSLTLPYNVEFTLRRAKEDGSDRPCIFRWSPAIGCFSSSGFLSLLHHTTASADGFEPLEIDHTGLLKRPENDWNHYLWEFAPGNSVRFVCGLPARYYKVLQAGETYTPLYPGDEVAIWDWGTIQEHLGKEVQAPPAEASGLTFEAGRV
jgi:hypothetical protein